MEGLTHWDAILIAAIAAVPPTITAFAALVASLRNGINAQVAATKAEQAANEASQVKTELAKNTRLTAEVKQLTNGDREKAMAQIDDLTRTVAGLRESIGALKAELKSLKEKS